MSFYGEFEAQQIKVPEDRHRQPPSTHLGTGGSEFRDGPAADGGMVLLGVQMPGMLSLCVLLNIVSVCVCVRVYRMRRREFLNGEQSGKHMV